MIKMLKVFIKKIKGVFNFFNWIYSFWESSKVLPENNASISSEQTVKEDHQDLEQGSNVAIFKFPNEVISIGLNKASLMKLINLFEFITTKPETWNINRQNLPSHIFKAIVEKDSLLGVNIPVKHILSIYPYAFKLHRNYSKEFNELSLKTYAAIFICFPFELSNYHVFFIKEVKEVINFLDLYIKFKKNICINFTKPKCSDISRKFINFDGVLSESYKNIKALNVKEIQTDFLTLEELNKDFLNILSYKEMKKLLDYIAYYTSKISSYNDRLLIKCYLYIDFLSNELSDEKTYLIYDHLIILYPHLKKKNFYLQIFDYNDNCMIKHSAKLYKYLLEENKIHQFRQWLQGKLEYWEYIENKIYISSLIKKSIVDFITMDKNNILIKKFVSAGGNFIIKFINKNPDFITIIVPYIDELFIYNNNYKFQYHSEAYLFICHINLHVTRKIIDTYYESADKILFKSKYNKICKAIEEYHSLLHKIICTIYEICHPLSNCRTEKARNRWTFRYNSIDSKNNLSFLDCGEFSKCGSLDFPYNIITIKQYTKLSNNIINLYKVLHMKLTSNFYNPPEKTTLWDKISILPLKLSLTILNLILETNISPTTLFNLINAIKTNTEVCNFVNKLHDTKDISHIPCGITRLKYEHLILQIILEQKLPVNSLGGN